MLYDLRGPFWKFWYKGRSYGDGLLLDLNYRLVLQNTLDMYTVCSGGIQDLNAEQLSAVDVVSSNWKTALCSFGWIFAIVFDI